MNEPVLEIELSEIQNAYRKLKHYVYYDNSNLFLRKQLADFEKDGMEDKLQFLQSELEVLINRDNKKFSPYMEKLFSAIDCWTLPKSYKPNDEKHDALLSNFVAFEKINVTRKIKFINAPIEIHIISVLWIMREGKVLQKGQDDLYGYKLELDTEGNVVEGLRLFKPYYEEYQNWRDRSIQTAKSIIEAKKNTLLIGLDIKDYYHSIELDEKHLLKEIGDASELNSLSSLLFRIHEYYTEHVIKQDGKPILPIGLLSSGILANYYLKKFDSLVKKQINPLFYGRYVDDILLTICLDSSNKYETNSEVLEKYFIQNEILKPLEDDQYQLYQEEYEKLYIQNTKISIMYFDHKSSLSMLDSFVQEIRKCSSEYRFLHAEELYNERFEG